MSSMIMRRRTHLSFGGDEYYDYKKIIVRQRIILIIVRDKAVDRISLLLYHKKVRLPAVAVAKAGAFAFKSVLSFIRFLIT